MDDAMAVRDGFLATGLDGLSVAVICAPFFNVDCPSMQIGLMAAVATQAGARARTYHLNVDLAQRIGLDRYKVLCEHRGRMTGEWLFSKLAFGAQVAQEETRFFDAFPDEIDALCDKLNCDRAWLSELRNDILPKFIDDCVAGEDWAQFDVIGFSSTFQQNVASLALARRLKEASPHLRIVFGGANFEGEMGHALMDAFDYVDYTVAGEGEKAFPALLERIAMGTSAQGVPGVIAREDGVVYATPPATRQVDLASNPIPDYREFFERLEITGLAQDERLGRLLPVEGSRGCWWGEKHHCTFCGLNGTGMAFRSKPADVFLDELDLYAQRYRITSFEGVDNILDMKYLSGLFGVIEERNLDYTFFFEVKANLRREQLRALKRGGVRWLQPGIESLSSHVLQLMDKGCTMLQNLRFLKWARYYRIKVGWNLIWGFPGETEADYLRQLEVAKLITHLEPPSGCGPIWLERFSPYFTKRDQFPVSNIRAEASYAHVYPDFVNIDQIAYFFDYDMSDTAGTEHPDIAEWITEWQQRWNTDRPDTLSYRKIADGILIDDDRGVDTRGTHSFQGALADLYLYCSDTYRSTSQAVQHVNEQGAYSYGEDEVRGALDEFCRRGLMVSEDDVYLSLAVPANTNL
ncbi:Radical SAM superfamily protein [Falsiruegeria litorea R37]|uniref:Radical SAM superfamily protein n=1 Tax=Falsiruegeria litorea R37 TaxID=1200284 RepID=A0A1Y5TTT8_9RHOB|nr:RiPP maturation radical SAM C-methyltransferase [Falsiruegeria litorea]SLN72192.1 Radical SAM superfamily protein [Falsiruegeria litorea R37]